MAEHTRARAAFDRYWRLGGDRSIERLYAELQGSRRAPTVRTIYEWSRTFNWQHRIADLDREEAAADQERRIRETREMKERHVKEGLLMQERGTAWLAGFDAGRVTASEATRAITEGARLEREGRGSPASSDEVAPRSNAVYDRLLGLSEEALDQFIDLLDAEVRYDRFSE